MKDIQPKKKPPLGGVRKKSKKDSGILNSVPQNVTPIPNGYRDNNAQPIPSMTPEEGKKLREKGRIFRF